MIQVHYSSVEPQKMPFLSMVDFSFDSVQHIGDTLEWAVFSVSLAAVGC